MLIIPIQEVGVAVREYGMLRIAGSFVHLPLLIPEGIFQVERFIGLEFGFIGLRIPSSPEIIKLLNLITDSVHRLKGREGRKLNCLMARYILRPALKR